MFDEQPTERPPRRKLLVAASVIALVLIVGLSGACIALALSTANTDNWGQWARDFAKSPGPAAFVALIAAGIAYRGISKQVEVARAALSHQRALAQEESWWAVFQWASGRAVPAGENDVRLPDSVTVSTLERLADDASTDVQRAACKSMIEFLSTRERQAGDSGDEVSLAPSDTVSALARYVQSTEGTSAASPAAAALVYENAVRQALASVDGVNVKFYRSPVDKGSDAILLVNERRLLLLVRWAQSTNGMKFTISQTLKRLRQVVTDDPFLVVTPLPVELDASDQKGLRAVVAQWRGPEDQSNLERALRQAIEM